MSLPRINVSSTISVDRSATATRSSQTVEAEGTHAPLRQDSVRSADVPVAPPLPQDQPVENQLLDMKKELLNLLARAEARSVLGLKQSFATDILNQLPRPGHCRAGHFKHTKLAPQIEQAAKACEKAMVLLGKIPAHAFAIRTEKGYGSDEALVALKTYTDAFHALGAKLLEYDTATKGRNPEVQKFYEATQFRIGEVLNLVSSIVLKAGNGETVEGKALDGLLHLAPKMHGALLFKGIAGKTDALFTKIAELEQQRDVLPFETFQASARTLAEQAVQLSAEAKQITGQVNPNDPTITLQIDTSLKEAITGLLDRAAERLLSLAKSNLKEELKRSFNDVMPQMNPTLFDDFKAFAHPLFHQIAKEFSPAVEQLNNSISDMRNAFLTGTPEQSAGIVQRGGEVLSEFARNAHPANVKIILNAIADLIEHKITIERFNKTITPALKYYFPTDRTREKMIDTLVRMVVNNDCPVHLRERAEIIGNSIFFAPTDVVRAQLDELQAMKRVAQTKQGFYNQYVLATFDHAVSTSTILELSLRNLPANQLEWRVGDDALVGCKTLGQGAANTVSLCSYDGADGEKMRLVFKPEAGARFGLACLRVSKLGYAPGARTMQLNLAATTAADEIGCGNVIARSSIGTLHGHLGLFMEHAAGQTARTIQNDKKTIAQLPNGRPLTRAKVWQQLEREHLLGKMRANLMRELSNLEWADLLSGQADRHADNYLVDIQPTTGEVKVTGIDNDASFSWRKVGMQRINVSDLHRTLKPELKRHCQYDPALKMMILDTSTMNETELGMLRGVFGFNQLFTPTHIDRATYEKLKIAAEQPDAYKAKMLTYMDETAANAAVERLKDAWHHAETLQAEGRVVDDWGKADVYTEMIEQQGHYSSGSFEASLRPGFFMRDFDRFFRAD